MSLFNSSRIRPLLSSVPKNPEIKVRAISSDYTFTKGDGNNYHFLWIYQVVVL